MCIRDRYTETLEAMEQKQIEKLGLLMTRELDKVEQTIIMQQAMDKKLENMEQKRQMCIRDRYYTAVSAMNAFQKDLDVTSNNMSNISTNGYKSMRSSFNDLLYTQMDMRPGDTTR